MLYRNDLEAITAMERARTGNYGEDYDDWEECEDDVYCYCLGGDDADDEYEDYVLERDGYI